MTTATSVTPNNLSKLSGKEMRRDILRRWIFRINVVIGWVAFIGVWYFFSRIVFDTRKLPEPHTLFSEAWTVFWEKGFFSNLSVSLVRVMMGFIFALIISASVGSLIAYKKWWRNLIVRIMLLIASTPTVSLAILSLVIFGVSAWGPIFTTTLVATPYIMINVARGITEVDSTLIVMSESYSRTRAQIIWGVLIPSSIISVLGGIRQAFAVAWRMELLTEVFGSSGGIGFQIRRSFESYNIQDLLAWTALYIVVMLILENFVFRQIERRMFGGIQSNME